MKTFSALKQIQPLLSNGEISLEELVSDYLKKINASQTNSFIEVFDAEALLKAKEIAKKIKLGTQGSLAGMVIGIKDNLCYKNHKSSGASKILENFESIFSATAIERLIAEDAIIIGRLNCDEFAMGSSNEKSIYGPTLNPHDNSKVPGGSSGGSAAAVAEGLCLASLGSDTGGSIRQPASFCGVVGVKPSYGRISRYGLFAYASSFDQIGTFTHSVDDAALLINIMSGEDAFDSTTSRESKPSSVIKTPNSKLRIAVPKDYLNFDGLDPEIKDNLNQNIQTLIDLGNEVSIVDFPFIKYIVPNYYVLTTAEACSNLARYDGAHYGYRSNDSHDIESTYLATRTEGFGIEVKRRIMLGNFVLSAGYYDAYFSKAQKVRRLLKDKTKELLNNNDVILTPTTPTTAFSIGEINDPIAMYLQDIFTVHANLTGMPAISIPITNHSSGLPYGYQIMSNNFEEDLLLST
ncbi:MAG: Asp-tRNA(Asn)/Glu-tRNA(Gln) amidotransferase subunit GatA, partial [Flavobacteriales bacterium]|nr:Asp-tRNA(Asn)/Glu-tRNA(Gln) amidotransferase subunit GatA [Flavobacteriales bacterium]